MKLIKILLSTTCAILLTLTAEAKPPELTPIIAKRKISDFLESHITHKQLSIEVVRKTIQNFINELDISKTYLLSDEVASWLEPDDAFCKEVQKAISRCDFSHFRGPYKLMLGAIDRRNSIEEGISLENLPQNVKASEFANMDWVQTHDDLKERIYRIRGLQAEAAAKIDSESKELLIKRLEKSRITSEKELQGENDNDQEKIILSYVLKAFATALDTHTVYFTPSEANQFTISVHQRLFGIGANLRDDLNGLTIVNLVDGGPAEQSGQIKIGDRVIAVNQEPIIGMSISDAVELIRGPENTTVTLTVMREYEVEEEKEKKTKKLDIVIKRQEIVLSESRFQTHVEPFGNGVVASIRLHSFYQDSTTSSAKDLRDTIKKLKKENNLLGLILDLRTNGGGLLTQAVDVAGLFINRGIVASIKDSEGRVQHLRNFENNPIWTGPLIVITNKASASASEIVAQSLHDYGRALVVGDAHTFGKGTYQIFSLDSNHSGNINPQGEFKVTRGMYFTVSGKSPQFTGLAADIIIPGPFSRAEVGERYTDNAIANASIDPHFKDDLADVHPLHRFKMKAIYNKNLQEPSDHLDQYVERLTENSEKRQQINPNYIAFIEDLDKDDEDYPKDAPKNYGKIDLQQEEAINVMKDLILMTNVNKDENRKAS